MRLLVFIGICLAPLAAVHAQKGHRVTSRSVVVNRAAHWHNWQLPTHAVQVSPGRHRRAALFSRALQPARRLADLHSPHRRSASPPQPECHPQHRQHPDPRRKRRGHPRPQGQPLLLLFLSSRHQPRRLKCGGCRQHPRRRSNHLLGARPASIARRLVDRNRLGSRRGGRFPRHPLRRRRVGRSLFPVPRSRRARPRAGAGKRRQNCL